MCRCCSSNVWLYACACTVAMAGVTRIVVSWSSAGAMLQCGTGPRASVTLSSALVPSMHAWPQLNCDLNSKTSFPYEMCAHFQIRLTKSKWLLCLELLMRTTTSKQTCIVEWVKPLLVSLNLDPATPLRMMRIELLIMHNLNFLAVHLDSHYFHFAKTPFP